MPVKYNEDSLNTKDLICYFWYWHHGNCTRGDQCKYAHADVPGATVAEVPIRDADNRPVAGGNAKRAAQAAERQNKREAEKRRAEIPSAHRPNKFNKADELRNKDSWRSSAVAPRNHDQHAASLSTRATRPVKHSTSDLSANAPDFHPRASPPRTRHEQYGADRAAPKFIQPSVGEKAASRPHRRPLQPSQTASAFQYSRRAQPTLALRSHPQQPQQDATVGQTREGHLSSRLAGPPGPRPPYRLPASIRASAQASQIASNRAAHFNSRADPSGSRHREHATDATVPEPTPPLSEATAGSPGTPKSQTSPMSFSKLPSHILPHPHDFQTLFGAAWKNASLHNVLGSSGSDSSRPGLLRPRSAPGALSGNKWFNDSDNFDHIRRIPSKSPPTPSSSEGRRLRMDLLEGSFPLELTQAEKIRERERKERFQDAILDRNRAWMEAPQWDRAMFRIYNRVWEAHVLEHGTRPNGEWLDVVTMKELDLEKRLAEIYPYDYADYWLQKSKLRFDEWLMPRILEELKCREQCAAMQEHARELKGFPSSVGMERPEVKGNEGVDGKENVKTCFCRTVGGPRRRRAFTSGDN